MKSDRTKRLLAVVGLVLFLSFPALPLTRWTNEFANTTHLVHYEIIWWLVVIALMAYVRLIERRSLQSIGLKKPGAGDLIAGVVTGIVMVVGFGLIYYQLFPALHVNEQQSVNQLLNTPLWWRIISVVRAGVAEEMIFRGYGFERLRELLNSTPIAAILTWIIFTVEHLSDWSWPHLLVAGFGGALLTAVYVWRRNLSASIVAHMISDGVSVLLG